MAIYHKSFDLRYLRWATMIRCRWRYKHLMKVYDKASDTPEAIDEGCKAINTAEAMIAF